MVKIKSKNKVKVKRGIVVHVAPSCFNENPSDNVLAIEFICPDIKGGEIRQPLPIFAYKQDDGTYFIETGGVVLTEYSIWFKKAGWMRVFDDQVKSFVEEAVKLYQKYNQISLVYKLEE